MGKGSSGGGDSTTTTVQQLSPEQKSILAGVVPILKQYGDMGMGGISGTVYPGSGVAPMNALQQQGGNMVTGAAGATQGAIAPTVAGNSWLASGAALDPSTNPGLQGTINAAVRPLTENFQQTVLPGIRDSAVLSGGYGSNRQEINERMAGNDYLRSVGDVSSAIAFQGYNAGLDATGRAQAFAPSIWQGASAPGAAVSAVGGQQQAQQQAMLNDQIQQYYNKQYLPLLIAQQIAGTAFGYPGGSTIANTSGGGGGGFSGANALSGAVGGASIGGAIGGPWGAGGGAILGGLLSMF